MTPLAPHLTEFLCERLPRQRGASEHTCASVALTRLITGATLKG